MSLKPILRSNLSEQVAAQIRDTISSGQWKPGDKLPSESDLCKTLNVSRSTVREALRSLSFIGLVEMRAGQGTYVASGPSKFPDGLLTHGHLKTEKNFQDLIDARIAIETELAALCAERATDEELQELERVVREMERTLHEEGEEFLELDVEFHIAIAKYSKSTILAQLLGTIRSLLQEFIRKSAQFPGDSDRAYAGHLQILQTLRQHSAQKSRTAMRNHLQSFQRRYNLILPSMRSSE